MSVAGRDEARKSGACRRQIKQLLLDPKADRVPGTPQDASLVDSFQRQQRHFGQHRIIGRSDPERADRLAAPERGDQGVRPDHLRFELGAAARWYRHHNGFRTAQIDYIGLTLPDRGGHHRLGGVKQLDHFKSGLAPVKQFLRLGGPGVFTGGAQHNGHETAISLCPLNAQAGNLTLGGGDHAKTRCRCVAGFEAVD